MWKIKCMYLCMGTVFTRPITYPLFRCRFVFIIIIIIILSATFFLSPIEQHRRIYLCLVLGLKMQLYNMHQTVVVLNARGSYVWCLCACVRFQNMKEEKYVCFGIIIICDEKRANNKWMDKIYFIANCIAMGCMAHAWCASWVHHCLYLKNIIIIR